MKKKLQTIVASVLVVAAAAIPVFANVAGLMTSTSTTMTTTTVPVEPEDPDKPEQKLPDYFIDLKDGLKVGKDYSGITIGANAPTSTKGNGDMLAKETTTEFELNGEKYTSLYLVQGTDNPKPDGEKVPETGAFIKVQPVKNGIFTVVVNQSNVKDVYFVQKGAEAPLDTFKTVAGQVIVKSYEVKKGETYYFYAGGSKVMIGGLGIKYEEDQPDTFVAVTGITGVIEKMTAGETVTLTGTAAPENATNKTIVWSIKEAGTTGAVLSGNKLTAKTAGKVIVTATIEKGASADKAFTKDFTIEVEKKGEEDKTVAVTGITGVVTEMKAGETITLTGTVAPENATNKTIVWSVKDAGTTKAAISGNKLTAEAAGKVVVTATIEKGISTEKAYTQDFTIEVKASGKDIIVGDADGSGGITTDDALAILKFVAGIAQNGFVEEAADVDGAGGITTDDALAVLRIVAGVQ